MARRDLGRPSFPPMAPKRVNNKYPRNIAVEARVFTVSVPKSSRDITHLRRGTRRDLLEEALASFRNSLPPRIARANAAIRIGTRPPRSRRRRSSLCRRSHLSLERRALPPCDRMRRGLRNDRSQARACERARVRECVRDISLEYARIYLPTL